MIFIAFDVAEFSVLQVHFDAATACAHVARGRRDLIAEIRREVDIAFV